MPTVDVGVELGGTKIVVASSLESPEILGRERIVTGDPESTLAEITSAIERVAEGHEMSALGIATFGPIDLRADSEDFGTLMSTPKPGWTGVNVVEALCSGADVPYEVDTDVNAAVRAEKLWGSDGYEHVAYITVGTGIGGGIWSNGQVITGSNHPEIGHIRVPSHPEDHYASSCPFHSDCLEGKASGTALRERWGRPAEDLGELATSATKLEAWYLARGIAGMCAVVPVEKVVIGGGVAKMSGLHLAVADALLEASGMYPPIPFGEGGPVICVPELGDNSGVVGALELAKLARSGR